MGKLRPREIEQPACSHSASLVELGLLLHRAVLMLAFGQGSGFSSLIEVAGGLRTWQSLPQMGVLEIRQLAPHGSTGFPGQEPAPSLLTLWVGRFQACPRS